MPQSSGWRIKSITRGSQRWRVNSFIILIAFLSGFVFSGCREADESWSRVQRANTLVVGLDPTYPPFAFEINGDLQGIDVDIARMLADELNVEVQFIWFGYDGLYDGLATKQVDILISGLIIDPGRTQDFAYSEPYFNAGEQLVIPTEEKEISSMRDLNGRSLAVELGAQGHVEATKWQRSSGDITIIPYETAADALTAVLNQEAHAALTDAITVRIFLGAHQGLTAVGPAITTDPFAIVVRHEDKELLKQINLALEQIEASGKLEQILQHWFES